MKRSPSDIIAAMKVAYRPDAPSSLDLVPGDHEAIAKLEEQVHWLAVVRRWMSGNASIKYSFDAFVAKEKAHEGGVP